MVTASPAPVIITCQRVTPGPSDLASDTGWGMMILPRVPDLTAHLPEYSMMFQLSFRY